MHKNLLNPAVPRLAPLDSLHALRSNGGLGQR